MPDIYRAPAPAGGPPITPLQAELIERVRGLMEERGLSQTDLAKAAHYSTKHVNQILNGHASAHLDTWQVLLDAAEAAPAEKRCELCEREGDKAYELWSDSYRCSNREACQKRQRLAGYRRVV